MKPASQNLPEKVKLSHQIVLPTLLQTPVYSSIGPQSHFSETPQSLPMSDVWRTTSNVLLSMPLQPPASRALDSQSLILQRIPNFSTALLRAACCRRNPSQSWHSLPCWPTSTLLILSVVKPNPNDDLSFVYFYLNTGISRSRKAPPSYFRRICQKWKCLTLIKNPTRPSSVC